MSEKKFIDFNFRYRPIASTPDGFLFEYLQNQKPTTRKRMILHALRAFYLVAAYEYLDKFESLAELETMIRQLRETYDLDEPFQRSVNFEISIGYMGYSDLPDKMLDDDWWVISCLGTNGLDLGTNGTSLDTIYLLSDGD